MHGAYLCAARCCHHSVDVSPEMTPAVQFLGGEEFLAFFLTAGMVSSLASYAGRLRSLTGPTYSLGVYVHALLQWPSSTLVCVIPREGAPAVDIGTG